MYRRNTKEQMKWFRRYCDLQFGYHLLETIVFASEVVKNY